MSSPYPETVELKSSIVKAIIFNVICGFFTAGSAFMFFTGERGWWLIFFPLCSLVFLWMLIKPAKVTLEPDHITLSQMGKNMTHKWDEFTNIGYSKVKASGNSSYFLTGDKIVKDKLKNIVLGSFDVKMKPDEFLRLVYEYQQDALRDR